MQTQHYGYATILSWTHHSVRWITSSSDNRVSLSPLDTVSLLPWVFWLHLDNLKWIYAAFLCYYSPLTKYVYSYWVAPLHFELRTSKERTITPYVQYIYRFPPSKMCHSRRAPTCTGLADALVSEDTVPSAHPWIKLLRFMLQGHNFPLISQIKWFF